MYKNIFYQRMPVEKKRNENISYLSLTFLCESRVYLSMEICKKDATNRIFTDIPYEVYTTLAQWKDYVNNKMIFECIQCLLFLFDSWMKIIRTDS